MLSKMLRKERDTEDLINRIKGLLIYMSKEEAALYLDSRGFDRGEAFLAIHAAYLLLKYEGEVE